MVRERPDSGRVVRGLALLALLAVSIDHARADDRCGDFAAAAQTPTAAAAASLATLLRIPDAATAITAVESVPAAGTLPAYCRFRGLTAPQINFELRLPAQNWNGKLLMQGCGGMCGWLNMGATEDALERHYAVVNTDMGHAGPPAVALWAHDNRSAELDFAYRSTYTTAVVAKAIVEQFYRQPAKRAYFNGCSTGGRQGMLAAQRFPELFDGIIAGAPVFNQTGVGMLHLLWSARANVDAAGKPILSAAKLRVVREGVLAACDRLDGVADGVIPDPRACGWKPESLACDANRSGVDCLNAGELGALRRLYDGASNSTGRLTFAGGGGLTLGSEYAWVPMFVNEAGRHGVIIESPSLVEQLVQYKVFYVDPGATATMFDFDFERDVPRLALTEYFYNAQNPDLRRYKARGGKLLLYHGWDDTEVTPGYSVDYYETATRTMGGSAATRDFFRLFLVPGMGHCRRGVGADAIDYLSYLERWVENGEAPDSMLAHKLVKEQSYLGLPRPRFPLPPADYQWRRPVTAYPEIAVFTGAGDWRDPQAWRAKRRLPSRD